MTTSPGLEDRFVGSLLGLALGDALGAHFEAQSCEAIRRRYPTARHLFADPPAGEWWYTDDTQMAIGVAEALLECGRIDEGVLSRRFAENYLPQRGYGRGTRKILEAMLAGEDHRRIAENHFPGGSLGNGAAMRVAPVGLAFHRNHDALWEQAELSARPTHLHPLAIEGAQLLALAVALAVNFERFDRESFFASLTTRATHDQYKGPLRRAAEMHDSRDLVLLGNGIEATASVVTAIACFACHPDSYEATIGTAILLGGDTDTIAAMAGALSGALLGIGGIPVPLLDRLEDRHQGRTYIEGLARQLHAKPSP